MGSISIVALNRFLAEGRNRISLLAIAQLLWIRSLKRSGETGYGMAKKLAAVRFGIPLIAGLAATLILNSNIAGIVDILLDLEIL